MATGVSARAGLRRLVTGTAENAQPESQGANWARDYRRMAAALAALIVAFSIAPVYNCIRGNPNKDYNLWYWTGRALLSGGEVYPRIPHRLFPFMYPPSCAAMLAVASTVGELPFVVSLVLLNSAAWVASILLAVYLATGHSLRQRPIVYLLPTAVVIPYIHDMYLLGQPNLLLLALMLGACACLRLGRENAAGVLVGLAAAVKAFPILAVCYLVYRRRWKATVATVLTVAVLVCLAPMVFRGPKWAMADLVTWTKWMVLKYDADSIAQRPERCYSFKNQSMMALANRLLRSIPADGEKDDRWKVNLADLDFKMVNTLIAVSGLGLCVFYLVSMPRAARRTPRTDAIEQAMLLLMILMFSPLSFNYFFVWLLYAVALALAMVHEAQPGSRERRMRIAWLGAALGVFALALPFPRLAQAYGNVFLAALVLLIAFGLELRRLQASPTTPGATLATS